jgi:PAS domain S-box-containing protein
LRVVLPDGTLRWLEFQGRGRRDAAGAIVGQIGIGMDITERKTAEDQLHRRSQEFAALVEHAPDIIAHFDRDLRYLYVNPVAERAIGLPSAALVGTKIGEFGVPTWGTHTWELSLSHVLSSGRELTSEVPLETRLGERHYQARFAPEFALDGTVESVLCIARDITERKHSDDDRTALYRELLDREQRMQDLVRRALLRESEPVGPRTPEDAEALERLSQRDRDILRLVAQGGSNRSIGNAIGLSPGTVKNRLGRIFDKLEVTDRTQAALRAAALGLT